MQFQFGFDIKEIEWYIHSGIRRLPIDNFIIRIIAEYVGNSKFLCYIKIFYKKLAMPWWEQEAIVSMKYCSDGEYINIVDFSPEEEFYFVQGWPNNRLLIADYDDVDLPDLLHWEEENLQSVLEKKFLTTVCSQIIHICICKTPAPRSCAVRNVLKQLAMVLKGWFVGVFLGESIDPTNLVFEYDTGASHLAPIASVT